MSMSSRELRARKEKLARIGVLPSAVAFRCDICQKPFPSASALIAHGQKAHGK